MSLRHVVPVFQPALEGVSGKALIVPRLAQPKVVGFRAGAKLDEVIASIKASRSVRVDAAVGAGKSVRLPSEIASALGVMVLHVLPSDFLADSIASYVGSTGKPVVHLTSWDGVVPDHGVVTVSAACLVAKWLEAGYVTLPPCVLYHDEVHESDAYSHMVRTLSVTTKELVCYVAATATVEPGGFRQPELAGSLVKHVYDASNTSDVWDIYGQDPWSVNKLVAGHTLVFEDDKGRAERLVSEYQMAGYMAYRMHAKMSLQQFQHVMKLLYDKSTQLMIVIADYSFRSGYTFPVSVIIDTAEVRTIAVENGRPMRRVRSAYALERYQAQGRGGRLPGLQTHYYCPDTDAPEKICDLESTEVEAVVLMYRVLGYAVPKEFASAVLADGGVPRDLRGALAGPTPLATIHKRQMLSLDEYFRPSGRRSPLLRDDVELNPNPIDLDQRFMADIANKHNAGGFVHTHRVEPEQYHHGAREEHSVVQRPVSGAGVASRGQGASFHDNLVSTADALQSLTSHQDVVESVDVGTYYYAVGLRSADVRSAAFPDGHESVIRMLGKDRSGYAHRGLSEHNQSVAVNALLRHFNIRTVELHAMSVVLPSAKHSAVGKDLSSVREWARTMGERLYSVMAELQLLSDYLVRLTDEFCSLVPMDPLVREQDSLIAAMQREVAALPVAGIGPPDDFMRHIRDSYRALPEVYSASGSSDSGISMRERYDAVEAPYSGRGMRVRKPSVSQKFVAWAAGGTGDTSALGRRGPKLVQGRHAVG